MGTSGDEGPAGGGQPYWSSWGPPRFRGGYCYCKVWFALVNLILWRCTQMACYNMAQITNQTYNSLIIHQELTKVKLR